MARPSSASVNINNLAADQNKIFFFHTPELITYWNSLRNITMSCKVKHPAVFYTISLKFKHEPLYIKSSHSFYFPSGLFPFYQFVCLSPCECCTPTTVTGRERGGRGEWLSPFPLPSPILLAARKMSPHFRNLAAPPSLVLTSLPVLPPPSLFGTPFIHWSCYTPLHNRLHNLLLQAKSFPSLLPPLPTPSTINILVCEPLMQNMYNRNIVIS